MSTDVGAAARREHAEEPTGWDRFAPLSGAAFFVLVMAGAISAGETPAEYASGAKVLSAFTAHAAAEKVTSLLSVVGVIFLVMFAGRLHSWLRSRGSDALASAAFGGALILGVGGAGRAGIGWALASGHDDLTPDAAQALYVLSTTHYPAIVGIAVYMFAASGAILRTSALPAWLGWAALVIGLGAIAPPTLAPLIGAGLWSSVAGVMMYRQEAMVMPL